MSDQKQRRRGDHPWENAARIVVASVLGLGLGRLLFTDGFHDTSDVGLIVLALLIGAMFKLPIGQILDYLPGFKRKKEG